MKIIYGKGECVLDYSTEVLKSIVIKYRGTIKISHNHMRFNAFLSNDKVLIRNPNSKSLLIHGNNQIHIGYLEGSEVNNELFRYSGNFKILSAKVNRKNVQVKATNIDYWNLIDSKWDYAGKPELYRGTYYFGRSPKGGGKTIKAIGKGISRRVGKRTGGRLPARTATSGSGGGY